VHLIHKHNGALPLRSSDLSAFYRFADFLDATQHSTDAQKMGIKGAGHQSGDGGFARARWSPEDATVGLTRLKRQPQRHAFAQQLRLPHHIPQRLWTQLFGQGRIGTG
jgi:hypothetical protein